MKRLRILGWVVCFTEIFHLSFVFSMGKSLGIYYNKNYNILDIFTMFTDCHLKFILLGGNGANKAWNISDLLENVAKSVFEKLPISIYTFNVETFRRMTSASKTKNMSRITCMTHVYLYIEEEFIFEGAVHGFIFSVLSNIRLSGEWPHHSVFMSYTKSNQTVLKHFRYSFFTYGLIQSSVRGLIIFVDFKNSQAFLVCVPCINQAESIFKPILQFSCITYLTRQMITLNSNMRQGAVFGVPSDEVYKSLCNPTGNPSKAVMLRFPPRVTDCVHYILRSKLNYTYLLNRSSIIANAKLMVVNKFNVDYITKSAITQCSPYLPDFEKLHLNMYQQRTRISAEILILVYHWKVWLLFLSSIALLIMFSVLWTWVHKIKLSMMDILLIVPASTLLEQGLSKKHKLPDIWRLWIAMMLALSCAYKAVLYELLAHGISLRWPSSLKELMLDDNYITVTVSEIYLYSTGHMHHASLVREEFLEPAMLGTPGVDYPVELYQLNKSLIFYFKNISLVTDIISQNSDLATKTFAYSFDGKRLYKKIATINRAGDSLVIHRALRLMYKNLAASATQTVMGHQMVKVWIMTNSFFFEYFENALGLLDQSGFLTLFEQYLMKMRACNATVLAVEKLTARYGVAMDLAKAFRRCYMIALFGEGNVETESEPLGMNKFLVIFILFFAV